MKPIKIFCYLIILFFFILFSNNYAQNIVKYNLSNSDIEFISHVMHPPDSTFSILIKLNNEGTQKFKEFTKNNIGNMVGIFKNKHLIQENTVKGEISTGYISTHNLINKNEVIKVFKILIE